MKRFEQILRFPLLCAVWLSSGVLGSSFGSLLAQVYLTQEKALAIHYPDATFERKTLYLTDIQAAQIEKAARSKLNSKVITYYTCSRNNTIVGRVFFDTEVIRTQKAAYMVAISPGGIVHSVEILAFYEPEDYLPPPRWLVRFTGKTTADDLYLKRGVPNISGATISAQTISNGVRRFLTMHQLFIPKD